MAQQRVKFPYGISNIEKITKEGYVLVDKTKYIELLESDESNVVFLRPRRIGKSLFVSMLEYYYDVNRKHLFESIFSKYYIGQHPTPMVNGFRVLKMDFSGIDTHSNESSYRGFLLTIKLHLESFLSKYELLSPEKRAVIEEQASPAEVMKTFFTFYNEIAPDNKLPIYLIIDEYDHFTNEILIRDLAAFKSAVSSDGYVRKFYETIKEGTQQGHINRFFITGVSPITLDSMTSGFNIVKHLTEKEEFHDMMGFSEIDTLNLLDLVLEDKSRMDQIMQDLKAWYNGYNFNVEVPNTIYNADMVLYFLDNFKSKQTYPRQMLDPNIMPDYGKLMRLFRVANVNENIEVLEEVLSKGAINTELIYQFSFDRPFGKIAFVNLLYYLGNLTLQGTNSLGLPTFVIPNYVIKELYWQYYATVLQDRAELPYQEDRVKEAIFAAAGGDVAPFFGLIEKLLKNLSNRDYQKFDEKYIKLVVMAYAMQGNFYYVRSEREVANDGYFDLELLKHPANTGKPAEYVFEIKYLKKEQEAKLASEIEAAKAQLQRYLDLDEDLQNRPLLRALVIVVVKDEVHWEFL